MPKPVDQLTAADLTAFPVWEYDLNDEATDGRDETWVRPVELYPVADLANRIIGTSVTLHNGVRMVARLGNVALGSETATREFLTLNLWHRDQWTGLARYFDVDHARRGPRALSQQLGLTVDGVFPILYDISAHAQGLEAVLRGSVEAEPKRRLSENERISLAPRAWDDQHGRAASDPPRPRGLPNPQSLIPNPQSPIPNPQSLSHAGPDCPRR
jgi:hypothetical protein